MCIVQPKSLFTRNNGPAALLQLFEQMIEHVQASIKCLPKLLLFKTQKFYDAITMQSQFDIVSAHQIYHRIGCLGQERFIQPKQFTVWYSTAKNAPENVATPFIARQDTIGSQEDQSTGMVCNHAQRDIGFRVLPIRGPGELCKTVDDDAKRIGIKDRLSALQDHREAFQT